MWLYPSWNILEGTYFSMTFGPVQVSPFCFYKRPTLVPVFANQKESKEDFHLYLKRRKAKIVFSDCSAASPVRGSVHAEQPGESGTTRLLPCELHAASQHQACIVWNCVCELLCSYLNLFCASVTKMCPRVTASSLYSVSAYERFHRSSLLSDSGGNLHFIIPDCSVFIWTLTSYFIFSNFIMCDWANLSYCVRF